MYVQIGFYISIKNWKKLISLREKYYIIIVIPFKDYIFIF